MGISLLGKWRTLDFLHLNLLDGLFSLFGKHFRCLLVDGGLNWWLKLNTAS
jgi:hypothetical protein